MRHTESSIEAAIVQYHNYQLANKNNTMLIKFVNEGKRSLYQNKQLAKCGMVKGASDLILLINGTCVFIEVKVDAMPEYGIKKTYQSKEQKEFEAMVKALGYDYHVVRSVDEFNSIYDGYLN